MIQFGTPAACSISLNTILDPEDRDLYQSTAVIRNILGGARTIAVVGLSTEQWKASNMVAAYLQDEGYKIVPVNPRATEILGERCYPNLKEIPFMVDVVDVFRPVSELPAIVDDAIAAMIPAIWFQLRIIDLVSAKTALQGGLNVVVDKCMKMEHGRFGGSLHWAGMNTEVVSARRPKMKMR
jgi:predicted CoA-binding protein